MKIRKGLWGAILLGLIAMAWIGSINPGQLWPTVLLCGLYGVFLSLGGVLFLAVQNVSGARWDAKIQVVPETLARCYWFPAALVAVALLFGHAQLHGWVAQEGSREHFLNFRGTWLSAPFLIARAFIYLSLWGVFVAKVKSFTQRRDVHTRTKWSAGFLVVFGISFSLASFDWLMSIEPGWTSTIFAVYSFSGLFLSTLAAVAALAILLRRMDPLHHCLTEAHLHDLGKLIFGFSLFWAYIWYCQYLLIWYTNLPEETSYYLRRHSGGWAVVSLANVVLNWVVPFFALLSKEAKRNELVLFHVCLFILLGRWLDLYIILMPRFARGGLSVGVAEGLVLTGTAAFMALLFFRHCPQKGELNC